MFSLSKLTTLLVASVVVAANPTPVAPAPAAGPIFAVYPGWDMANGGSPLTGGSEQSCMKLCAATATCLAYAYVPYGSPMTPNQSACYLKSTIDLKSFRIQPYDVSTGLAGPCGTFPVVGPTNCFTSTLA